MINNARGTFALCRKYIANAIKNGLEKCRFSFFVTLQHIQLFYIWNPKIWILTYLELDKNYKFDPRSPSLSRLNIAISFSTVATRISTNLQLISHFPSPSLSHEYITKEATKIYKVPGPVLSTGGRGLFWEKKREGKSFLGRKKGAKIFLWRKKGGEEFFWRKKGANKFFFSL